MSQKLKWKILVDFIMIILFTTLLFAFDTGLMFHEVVGILIFFIFGLHVLLNRQWVKKVAPQLWRMKAKIKGMFLLNLLLAAGVTVIVVTGILISQVLFPLDWGLDRFVLVLVHRFTSYACVGLFALHLVLHARYLAGSVKKIMGAVRPARLKRMLVGLAALAIICAVFLLQLPSINGDTTTAGLVRPVIEQVETSATEDTVSAEISATADEAASSETQSGTTSSDATATTSGDEDAYIKRDDVDSTIDSDATVSQEQADESVPSLSDYLGNLFCTACHRHCSLLSPQCAKGVEQAQAAEAQYLSQYGDSITAD